MHRGISLARLVCATVSNANHNCPVCACRETRAKDLKRMTWHSYNVPLRGVRMSRKMSPLAPVVEMELNNDVGEKHRRTTLSDKQVSLRGAVSPNGTAGKTCRPTTVGRMRKGAHSVVVHGRARSWDQEVVDEECSSKRKDRRKTLGVRRY
jgi:hypothetical protein